MKKKIFCLIFFITIGLVSKAQTKIISTGDDWEYYDLENAPQKNWEKEIELLSEWKIGASPLGYGNPIVNTTVSYGDNENKKHITKYFKKTFRIEKPLECIAYKIGIIKDDGAVVYLNGREIMRINMPDGPIVNDTRSSNLTVTEESENYVHTKILAPDDFVAGLNTLSISVHQGREDSGDCIFSLELTCENNSEMLTQLLKENTLKNISLNYKIKVLENRLGIEKKDLEIEFLNRQNSKYKNNSTIAIILLILLLLYLIYYFFQNKKTNNKLSQNIEHLKALNFDKDQELMSYSLNSIQSQQFFKEIKSNLQECSEEDNGSLKKEMKKIIRQIDFNIEHDDDWLKLLNHFNSIYKGYLNRLTKKHPTLSEIELRHCVFIKLYMQTKEIAQILHIDPRSVQAARYRIKKKINLPETTDLRNYLQEF